VIWAFLTGSLWTGAAFGLGPDRIGYGLGSDSTDPVEISWDGPACLLFDFIRSIICLTA